MPNWCTNIVCFNADPATLQTLQTFFEALIEKENRENKGQLPPFCAGAESHMFSIRWEDDTLYFETRWGPDSTLIKAISTYFSVDLSCDYLELDMQVFGKIECKGGELIVFDLDPEDLEQCTFDEANDVWLFEGKAYSNEIEIYDMLLERKIAKAKQA